MIVWDMLCWPQLFEHMVEASKTPCHQPGRIVVIYFCQHNISSYLEPAEVVETQCTSVIPAKVQ
uniref:Uncharacterized protein n=1 Tax=Arundo donax TaxID=35708 RepID=A0A0A9C1Y4_ARUDO